MSKEFGVHLRELRKAKGYTQQQMADLLNIGRSTYTYYETGKSQPSFQNLKKLCEILEIDYNTILILLTGGAASRFFLFFARSFIAFKSAAM